MMEVYHLQKQHPDAGEFRIWSLLATTDISVRTVGRIMALHRQVYADIPGGHRPEAQTPPQPHPYKATRHHQYGFIDGRKRDCAIDGVKWWSLIMLEGYSRAMVAGAVATGETAWAALTVLYTAARRSGVPETLISDHGGAFISNAFEAVCRRLTIDHKTITGRKDESDKNHIPSDFVVDSCLPMLRAAQPLISRWYTTRCRQTSHKIKSTLSIG